jgi:hypothetical protein
MKRSVLQLCRRAAAAAAVESYVIWNISRTQNAVSKRVLCIAKPAFALKILLPIPGN